jgi:hypothetical protein
MLTLHNRQFVISKQEVCPGPDWTSVDIAPSFKLSHNISLRLTRTNGTITLGHQVGDHSGRFVKIEWPYLYADAAAMLAVYFGADASSGAISSSPALLAKSLKLPISARQLRWGGMNWFPHSRVQGVRRLFRDQRLHIPTLTVERRPEQTLTVMPSIENARLTLASDLVSTAHGLARRSNKINVSLTAGIDSRTVFAAFLSAGVKFDAFTHDIPGILNPRDHQIARQICKTIGVKHNIVRMQPRRDDLAHIVKEHTISSCCDTDDLYLLPCNGFRFLASDDAVVFGGLFETGRRYFGSLLEGLNFDHATGSILWSRFEPDTMDSSIAADLDDWLAWRRCHGDGLDLVDSFYLDQRVGGWCAAIDQALDLLPGFSIHPANSLHCLSALVTPDPRDRSEGRLQRETISLLEPKLLRFPINPPRSKTALDYGRRLAPVWLRQMLRPIKQRLWNHQ